MRIDGNTTIGELFHADSGKGEPAKKHKYTRRYWSNGRWNYEYTDDKELANKSNSRDKYTFDRHKTVLPKKWASDTNEWNGKFVKGFVDAEKAKDIGKEYADRLNRKYNPFATEYFKDPSWIDKAKDKLGYDEAYTYRKASDIKERADDFADSHRKEADTEYETYKINPNDYGYESYQLAENIAQMSKADAETAGKLYIKAQEEFFETPLGKIEKTKDEAREWVESTIEDLAQRFKKKRKK